MSTTKESILSCYGEYLRELDLYLAAINVSPRDRPIKAASWFARDLVLQVKDKGRQWKPNFDSPDFYSERWFRSLYREIEDWYQKRYPADFTKPCSSTITGLVLIWDTPFALNVPTTVIRPGKPGKTIWISPPDSVLDTEDPTNWIAEPPDLSQLSRNEKTKLTESCDKIASLLRSIHVRIMGIAPRDDVVKGLVNQLKEYISHAAEDVLKQRQYTVTSGPAWQIQMACECAFKALLQQKTGSFRETHDLYVLYRDAAPHGLSLNRDLLKIIPQWREMASFRYGQGDELTVAWYYTVYRTMLRIVAAALKPMVTIDLGKASIEIAKAPWLETDDLDEG